MRAMHFTQGRRRRDVLLATGLYLVAFFLLYRWVGDGLIALSAAPIVVCGHALGRWGGATAGILMAPANYVLLEASGRWPAPIEPGAPFWFASVVLFGIGLLAGFFGEARMKLDQEVALREQTEAELRTALEEVQTLRGMVPICSSCKKIRRDDNSWIPVERFIQERSEASFTHGICPTCTEELYPD